MTFKLALRAQSSAYEGGSQRAIVFVRVSPVDRCEFSGRTGFGSAPQRRSFSVTILLAPQSQRAARKTRVASLLERADGNQHGFFVQQRLIGEHYYRSALTHFRAFRGVDPG